MCREEGRLSDISCRCAQDCHFSLLLVCTYTETLALFKRGVRPGIVPFVSGQLGELALNLPASEGRP